MPARINGVKQRVRSTRTPTLGFALDWIAGNDEPEEMDPEVVASLISVQLVADLWGRPPEDIAARIIERRLNAD